MHVFDEKLICGKTSGVTFGGAKRPQLSKGGSYECSDGWAPCIADMEPEKTICYKEEDGDALCPITDIKFVR